VYKETLGVSALQGEKGYTTLERNWARPTLDVNGIKGGYQGEGAKTIIPSMASCKITMRLVPDMEPLDICRKIEKYLLKIAPKSVKVKVVKHGGAKGVVVPTDGPWLEASSRAIEAGFGKKPVFMREGGSIPIVVDFKEILGLDTLLIGFGQNDDNVHSPNERFRIRDFENGCRTAAVLPDELAKVGR
jgi:succinyl-diaminopimelate desuccinylase